MPVKSYIADIIFGICQNKHTCFIQFPTDTTFLQEPVLWAWNDWVESYERDCKIKANAANERALRFIFDKNVLMLTRKIIEEWGWEFDGARGAAYSWLKKNKKGAMDLVGFKPITKESEL